MYGEAERVLALSLAGRRDQAIVATKVWAKSRAIGEEQIEQALAWYERVDLYQVHNLLATGEHLPYLRHLKDGGRVGAIGATHYLTGEIPALIELMRAGAIDTVQVPYHPLERTIERSLLPAAADLGVGVVIMMPLATGQLVRTVPSDQQLRPLAPFGVATWSQALLKWSLSDPRVHVVIPATGQPAHMIANAAAGHPPWFGADERRYVEQLAAAL
jgi:aryl-alcohol dehydrogenase-like predicted oxidoreductase